MLTQYQNDQPCLKTNQKQEKHVLENVSLQLLLGYVSALKPVYNFEDFLLFISYCDYYFHFNINLSI